MKSLEIIGYKRANLGKSDAKHLRSEGSVPCVLYGGQDQVHFHSPMILFRDLVYTPEAHTVDLNIEGNEYKAKLQDIQFHPVSEIILHADFLEIFDDKPIKMNIPVRTKGIAPGVADGGKLYINQRHLLVQALPADMPDEIVLEVGRLQLGKSIKVADIEAIGYEILTSDLISVISVETPRILRTKSLEEELAEEEAALLEAEEAALLEGEEGAEGAAGAEGGAAKEGGGEAPKDGGDESKGKG